MALKALMIKRSIDQKNDEFAQLTEKDADFVTREAELETAIGEANTDEEQAAVSEAVEAFENEKKEHDDKKARLSQEIETLSAELADLEAAEPKPDDTRTKKNPTERRNKMKIDVKLREIPMGIRAFDTIPYDTRSEIVKREDVRTFLANVREVMSNKRAISGGDLSIPVVFLELISENIYRYSKLLNRVRVRNVRGTTRQTIAGTIPEAVWTEMCGALNELNLGFNQITLDGYKVAGFVPVCNSLIEDSEIDLAAWVLEALSEGIGLAIDKAIIYGRGSASHMPLGFVTRLAQDEEPDGYPSTAPEWVDLSTTHLVKFDSSNMTPVQFMQAFANAAKVTINPYARGRRFWAMNSGTYAQIQAALIAMTADGNVVSRLGGIMPITDGDIDVLEFIPDGDIVGGWGDLYLFANREDVTLEYSTHYQFVQDNTVFRGKARADGQPIIAAGFVAMNINNVAPTTTMTFPADRANDADLQDLTIGTESLSPSFDPATLSYTVTAASASDEISATPANSDAKVAIAYNGKNVRNGATVTWAADGTAHPMTVTVTNGNKVKVYTINVTKASG